MEVSVIPYLYQRALESIRHIAEVDGSNEIVARRSQTVGGHFNDLMMQEAGRAVRYQS